jgi:hypothetical protein
MKGQPIRDEIYRILSTNTEQCMRTLDFWINFINSNIHGQKRLTKKSVCFNLKILSAQNKIKLTKDTKYSYTMYQIEV